jgi:hypothetical protein
MGEKETPPAPDDPRYRRTCTRCGAVRNWRSPCIVVTVIAADGSKERRGLPPDSGAKGKPGWTDFGCPRCGCPEFAIPAPEA